MTATNLIRVPGIMRTLLSLALTVLIIVVAVDPTDHITHMKVPAFCAVVALWIAIKMFSELKIRGEGLVVLAVAMSLLIPLTAVMSGLTQETVSNASASFDMAKAFLFFCLVVIVHDQHFRLGGRLARWTLLIAIATISIYGIFVLSPALGDKIYAYSLETGTAMIDPSRAVGFGMFYYKTSALLLFPLAYFLSQLELHGRRWVGASGAFLAASGLLLSGSRANILAAGAIILYYAYRFLRQRAGLVVSTFLAAVTLISAAAYVAPSWVSGTGNEGSNQIKYFHLLSYMDRFSAHPTTLLIGDGIGAEFKSRAEMISGNGTALNSELTYFETVRTLGLPLAIVALAAIMAPAFVLWRRRSGHGGTHWFVAYFAYLVVAGTNPLLFSSTGMIATVCMYSEAFEAQKKVDVDCCITAVSAI